jgi:DNA-directed RNA polymerase, mitochondrial
MTANNPREWTVAELHALQQELEETGFAEGRTNFLKAHAEAMRKGQATQSAALQKLIDTMLDRMEAAIKFWHMEQTTNVLPDGTRQGRKGRPHALVRWVELVGADVLAYLTLLEMIDGIAARRLYSQAVEAVAIRVQDEARYRRFKTEAAGLWSYRAKKNKKTRNRRHIKYSTDQSLRWANVDDSDLVMDDSTRIAVGEQLLQLAVDATGAWEVIKARGAKVRSTGPRSGHSRGGRNHMTSRYLLATPATLQWITGRSSAMAMLFPVMPPLVIPPKPWAVGVQGGYHYNLAGHFPLLRGARKAEARKALAGAAPEVYAALNALQRVRWVINEPILRVAQELWETGGQRAGLPSTEPLSLPRRPAEWAAMTFEERRVWRRQTSERYEQERERAGQAITTYKIITTAERLAGVPSVHFAWSCDFRGRVYPIATYLHPQGRDICRGVLTFADARPLGETGLYWLLVHGANCIDDMDGVKVSKLTFDERVAFVQARQDRILAAAADPLSNPWWQDLENPWQVLAFCYEYAALTQWVDAGNAVEDFCSSLPVMLDGTCNGAQHWSAALRDEAGGAAVNLLPTPRPRDMYSDVCDAVVNLLQADTEEPLAARWLASGWVTRKLVKVPSMTYFYGSGRYGHVEQLKDFFRKDPTRLAATEEVFGLRPITTKAGEVKEVPALPAACQYMAGVLDTALSQVVSKAYQGRRWLQHRTKLITARNGLVTWTVPLTGLRVRQTYYTQERHRVTTTVSGRRVKASYWRATQEVDSKRQANAVAPNVIHSLDAAALMLTIAHASAQGVQSIAMIHDSYGVHAADTEVMREATRAAFVRLYTEVDVVQHIEEQLLALLPDLTDKEREGWVAVPAPGTLDIAQVLVSDYFFA